MTPSIHAPFFSAQNAIFNVDVVVQCFTSSNPGDFGH